MVLLALEWVCVPAGVQKEKKNEAKQHKNEINAVSIQVTDFMLCLFKNVKVLGWVGWRCKHEHVPSLQTHTTVVTIMIIWPFFPLFLQGSFGAQKEAINNEEIE